MDYAAITRVLLRAISYTAAGWGVGTSDDLNTLLLDPDVVATVSLVIIAIVETIFAQKTIKEYKDAKAADTI